VNVFRIVETGYPMVLYTFRKRIFKTTY